MSVQSYGERSNEVLREDHCFWGNVWDSVKDLVNNIVVVIVVVIVIVVTIGKVDLPYGSKTGTNGNEGGINLLLF